MIYNRINLFLTGILVIILFVTIPQNNAWLYSKILEHNDIYMQAKHLNLEERREMRYGYSYQVYKLLEKRLEGKKDVVLLFPPEEYLKAMHLDKIVIPEPAVFYYYTGVKSVWVTSSEVGSANCLMAISNTEKIYLIPLNSKEQTDSVVASYKKYMAQL